MREHAIECRKRLVVLAELEVRVAIDAERPRIVRTHLLALLGRTHRVAEAML